MYTVCFSKFTKGSGWDYTTEIDTIDEFCTAQEYMNYMDDGELEQFPSGKFEICEYVDGIKKVLSEAYI